MFTKKEYKKVDKASDKIVALKLTDGLKEKAATADGFIDLLVNVYIPADIEIAEKSGEKEEEDYSDEVAMEIALAMKEVFKIQGAKMGGEKGANGLIDEICEALLYKAVKAQFKIDKAVKDEFKKHK